MTFDKEQLEKLNHYSRRNLVVYLGTVIILAIIIIGFILFYKPTIKIDTTLLKAKEAEIEALKSQTKAFEKLVGAQIERINMFATRDSSLLHFVKSNNQNILKIKGQTNEKIKVFDNYGADDWAFYFSQLPEPQR